ncbi:MAG: [NiFe]-hydrogenase assembly chaperone HybE [Halopseudomonas sp.]
MTNPQQNISHSVGLASDPGPELERIYQQILDESMQGLPVVNAALKVEAIDFIEWEGHWLGVLLTPWFMNLLVIPKQGSPWPEMKTGKGKGHEVVLTFPQGDYKFNPRDDEGFGSYLCCSLASPVHEWKTHIEARNTARDVMRLIKTLPVKQIEIETEAVAVDASDCQANDCQVSRRAFLSGGARP